ncbi:MAG: CDP-alcohol phosphatidyltransferase family protein [Elusimicrobiales bacterium]
MGDIAAPASAEAKPLYKAIEMEERLDIWFFHPLGYRIAKWSHGAGLLPDHISYASIALGVAGGAMLAWRGLVFWGWWLLVLSSVLDSADGQLARMRGGGTLRGRILDGLIGYFSFTAAYLGMGAAITGAGAGIFPVAALILAAGAATALEASMYDFHRTAFAAIVSRGELPDELGADAGGAFGSVYALYGWYQRFLAAGHCGLLAALRGKFGGAVPLEIRARYLAANRRNIRFWNLLGDNTRFLLIALAFALGRPEWYFCAVLIPLVILMLVMSAVQRESDAALARNLGLELPA